MSLVDYSMKERGALLWQNVSHEILAGGRTGPRLCRRQESEDGDSQNGTAFWSCRMLLVGLLARMADL